MRLTAVLFDFAGTLFMPAPTVELVAAGAAASGLHLAGDELERLALAYERAGIPGGPYPETVPDALARAYAERDLSPENHRRAYVGLLASVPQPNRHLADAVYDQVLSPQGWRPYADAAAVISTLARDGVRTGLVSNIGFDLRPILEHHGFRPLAQRCTLSYELGVTKPAPEIFRDGLRQLSAQAEETLMVGDKADADGGAVGVGMRALLLPMTPAGTEHGLGLVLEVLGGRGDLVGSRPS
jgi:FMN phosphatase YigB (HAD superfamily)